MASHLVVVGGGGGGGFCRQTFEESVRSRCLSGKRFPARPFFPLPPLPSFSHRLRRRKLPRHPRKGFSSLGPRDAWQLLALTEPQRKQEGVKLVRVAARLPSFPPPSPWPHFLSAPSINASQREQASDDEAVSPPVVGVAAFVVVTGVATIGRAAGKRAGSSAVVTADDSFDSTDELPAGVDVDVERGVTAANGLFVAINGPDSISRKHPTAKKVAPLSPLFETVRLRARLASVLRALPPRRPFHCPGLHCPSSPRDCLPRSSLFSRRALFSLDRDEKRERDELFFRGCNVDEGEEERKGDKVFGGRSVSVSALSLLPLLSSLRLFALVVVARGRGAPAPVCLPASHSHFGVLARSASVVQYPSPSLPANASPNSHSRPPAPPRRCFVRRRPTFIWGPPPAGRWKCSPPPPPGNSSPKPPSPPPRHSNIPPPPVSGQQTRKTY